MAVLSPLPIIGEPIHALNVYHKIKSLEKSGRFKEAKIVRKRATATLNPDYQGPILRSEGEDKLYRLKDYEGAIEVFEKAEITIEKSSFLYGVSQPAGVLSGIAIAAVRMGDKKKSIVYRDKLIVMYEGLKKITKKKKSLKWYEETIDWLNNAIESIE